MAAYPGIPGGSQKADGNTVNPHGAGVFIQVGYRGPGLVAVEKILQQAVGRIPFRVVGHIRKGGPGLASDVDDDFIIGFTTNQLPDRQLANPTEPINTNAFFMAHG